MRQNFEFSRGYFARHSHRFICPISSRRFLANEVPKHHGVVACEGSMFKSKFANALTTMMIGSLGIAAAQNKLSVGYGAEAGHMDPLVAKCAAAIARILWSLRATKSRAQCCANLGVPTELGHRYRLDFRAASRRNMGRKRCEMWAGTGALRCWWFVRSILSEWPVKASVAKFALHGLTGAYKDSHYRSVYFHNSGPAADRAYEHYLTSIANAVDAFRKQRNVFVILVATERLDARPATQDFRKAGWSAGADFGRLQHVRTGQHSARLPHDGFVALSRHCHFDAGAGAVSGHHHG